jgi:hypothetical protein
MLHSTCCHSLSLGQTLPDTLLNVHDICLLCNADLMHTLWEADVEVFKAHITTSPAGEVLDMFWLYDNRQQLPDHHRQAPAHHGATHHTNTLPLAAWCQRQQQCDSTVRRLSGCCHVGCHRVSMQDYCIRPGTSSAVSRLSGCCHVGCHRVSMQDYCIRSGTSSAVRRLSRCRHVGCHRMSMQDYCIRPGTSSAVRRLSGYCRRGGSRVALGHIVWHATPCQYLENSPMSPAGCWRYRTRCGRCWGRAQQSAPSHQRQPTARAVTLQRQWQPAVPAR